MTEKYRVHEIAKFYYSDIGEYIDENHTDRILRNDILVDRLNKQDDLINTLREELELADKQNTSLEEQINTMKGGFDESNEIIGELQKENEQLKEELVYLDFLKDENKQFKDKNEQLKQENKGIQEKVWSLLNYLDVEYNIKLEEIKTFWNDDMND